MFRRAAPVLLALPLVLGVAACSDDGGDSGGSGGSGGEAADLDFCGAVEALEVSNEDEEPGLLAALEADTPAGSEEDVAVVREYTDRRQAGEDVFQDSDFIFEYNNAASDLKDVCGLP